MDIPASHVGHFNPREARIAEWKERIDLVMDGMRALDQGSDDHDARVGSVEVSEFRPSQWGAKYSGTLAFDPASGQPQTLSATTHEMVVQALPDAYTTLKFERTDRGVHYQTSAFGISQHVTIDNATGTWHCRSTFLGVPI